MESLRALAMTETYEDTKLLLYKIAHRFAACYQLPFEDLLTVAHEGFVKAFDSYARKGRPVGAKSAKFSSFLYLWVSTDMISYVKKEQRYAHVELDESMGGVVPASNEHFLSALRTELSTNAAFVVDLVLASPAEFSATLRWDHVHTTHTYLRVLRRYLRDRGWTRKQVEDTFAEISAILTV